MNMKHRIIKNTTTMKKNIIALLISIFVAGSAVAQDEFTYPISVVADATFGFFSNQVCDFQVSNQPMLNVSVFSKVNSDFFVGGGLGIATWIYSDNEGEAKIENKNFSLPLYFTARYVFRTSYANLFLDAKLGYRLGNKVTIDMLSTYRTGQDDRIISGNGLFSAGMIGFSIKGIEFGMGVTLQNVTYDRINHSIVTATEYPWDEEEHDSKLMRSFFVQVGYWF